MTRETDPPVTVPVAIEDILHLEAEIEARLTAIDNERGRLSAMLRTCRIMRQVKPRRPKVEPIHSPTGRRSICDEIARGKSRAGSGKGALNNSGKAGA